MSVHYEVTQANDDRLQDKIKIWHDEDKEDAPLYEGVVGDFLYENADQDTTGLLWSEMEQFDEDFGDLTPLQVAKMVYNNDFNPDARYYGRVGDGPYVSLETRYDLLKWLYDNVNLGRLVQEFVYGYKVRG